MSEQPELRREPTEDREDEIDLAQLWGLLCNGKWVIAACTLLALLAGAFYLYVASPVYRADALLQVQLEQPPPALQGLMEATAMIPGGEIGTRAATQMQIITSRSVLGDVVEQRGLTVITTPGYFPLIGEPLASGGMEASNPPQEAVSPEKGWWLSHFAWGPAKLVLSALAVPDQLIGEPFTLRGLGGNQFVLYGPAGNKILAGEVGEPVSGQTRAGRKVSIFVQKLTVFAPPTDFTIIKRSWLAAVQSLADRISVSEQGEDTGILKLTLQGENREAITETLNAVANTYLRQNVAAQTQQAQQSLAFLKEQLPKVKAQLHHAVVRLTRYREKFQAVGLDAEAQALLNQLVALESKYSTVKLKIAELSETYTHQHPAINALEDQLASIEEQRRALQRQINQLPSTQKQILKLQRAVKVNTKLYTSLLNRAQELRILKAGITGNVRIIDHAVVPRRPVAPNRRLVLALSLVLGVMTGGGVVFLRGVLRRTIDDPRDIEQHFGLPVYAVIPYSERLARSSRRARRSQQPVPLLARDHPGETAIESLRSLRTSLYFAQMESGNNVILITGPAAEAGKTVVSINLAYLLAEAGNKVLVIDGDMRRGKLHAFRKQGREPGLSQVLTGQVSLEEALFQLDGNSCHILTSGRAPPNPSELLMRGDFHELLTRVSAEHDYVLIDAPPVLPVTDASVIAGTLPGIVTFIVARAGVHTRPEIDEAVKRMTRNGYKIAGVVFNGLRKEHARYSGGYAYYYHYKYESQG